MVKTIKIKRTYGLLFLVLFGVSIRTIGQNLSESKKRGEKVYETTCVTCHMTNGEGLSGAFPPLAKSDYLMSDVERSIKNILEGVNGEISVNGTTYYGAMVPYDSLTNQEIADVLNYVRNSWGNQGELIKPEAVAKLRK